MGSVTPLDIPDAAVGAPPRHKRHRLRSTGRRRLTQTSEAPDVRVAMHEEIHREMYRSRRYGGAVALLRISPPAVHLGDTRGPQLSTFLRLIDWTWTLDGSTWLLLPETGVDEGLSLLDRIRANAPLVLTGRSVGMAFFPETALTLEGLLEATNERMEESFRTQTPRRTITVTEQREPVSKPAM